jgi:hypothetical protein
MNKNKSTPGIIWKEGEGRFTGNIEASTKIISTKYSNYLRGRDINPHPTHIACNAIHLLTSLNNFRYTEENDIIVQKETINNNTRQVDRAAYIVLTN